jgi:hypothetical protein
MSLKATGFEVIGVVQGKMPSPSQFDTFCPHVRSRRSTFAPSAAGVWFRAHTVDRAQQLGLVGYVMNTAQVAQC